MGAVVDAKVIKIFRNWDFMVKFVVYIMVEPLRGSWMQGDFICPAYRKTFVNCGFSHTGLTMCNPSGICREKSYLVDIGRERESCRLGKKGF